MRNGKKKKTFLKRERKLLNKLKGDPLEKQHPKFENGRHGLTRVCCS